MEVTGYRDTLELLNTIYAGRAAISVEECAVLLGVNHKTVRESMHRVHNPIPSVKVGRRIVIPVAKLARWLCL